MIGTDLDARWLEDFKHLPVARIGHGAPNEPSVCIAVDENAAARQFIPAVTTIRQPIAAMATAAVNTVVQKKAPAQPLLEPELVVHESA